MSIAITYTAAMRVLADLAGPDNPPYVRVKAAAKLASELSPLNKRHADVMRALAGDQPPPGPPPITSDDIVTGDEEHPYACYRKDADASDEDDESEGANQDDDPL